MKTTVWGKICNQNPQRGDKGSVQMPHQSSEPPLHLNIDNIIIILTQIPSIQKKSENLLYG